MTAPIIGFTAVMVMLIFYASIAVGVIFLIFKRSSDPSRRSAQFLLGIGIIGTAVLFTNLMITGGTLDFLTVAMICVILMVCAKYLIKRKSS